jgi:hypothetical protein
MNNTVPQIDHQYANQKVDPVPPPHNLHLQSSWSCPPPPPVAALVVCHIAVCFYFVLCCILLRLVVSTHCIICACCFSFLLLENLFESYFTLWGTELFGRTSCHSPFLMRWFVYIFCLFWWRRTNHRSVCKWLTDFQNDAINLSQCIPAAYF